MSSLLAGDSEEQETTNEASQIEARSRYGMLVNPRACGRRGKVKFFDSADWARKSQEEGIDLLPNQEKKAPMSNLQELSENANEDGESPLANATE